MKKKRYNDGGMTGATQQPTYPFGTNVQPTTTSGTDGMGGVNQTFNMQPQATAQPAAPAAPAFKKGGKVASASKRADGCAMRGKTRGRMV
jgi:hypothetical protein